MTDYSTPAAVRTEIVELLNAVPSASDRGLERIAAKTDLLRILVQHDQHQNKVASVELPSEQCCRGFFRNGREFHEENCQRNPSRS